MTPNILCVDHNCELLTEFQLMFDFNRWEKEFWFVHKYAVNGFHMFPAP